MTTSATPEASTKAIGLGLVAGCVVLLVVGSHAHASHTLRVHQHAHETLDDPDCTFRTGQYVTTYYFSSGGYCKYNTEVFDGGDWSMSFLSCEHPDPPASAWTGTWTGTSRVAVDEGGTCVLRTVIESAPAGYAGSPVTCELRTGASGKDRTYCAFTADEHSDSCPTSCPTEHWAHKNHFLGPGHGVATAGQPCSSLRGHVEGC